MPKPISGYIVSDETAHRVAHIIGEQSAFARAIAECEHRRADGETDLAIFSTGASLLIVPRSHISDELPDATRADRERGER